MLLEPTHVIGLRAIGRRQLEPVFGQRCYGEIPDQARGGAEHGGQRQPSHLGDAPGHDPVEPGPGVRPFDQILAEVMDLVDADGLAHRPAFLRRRLEGIRAPERRRLPPRLPGQGEVVHRFHAVVRAEDGALRVPDGVGRGGLEGPHDRQFLVRIADREAALVVLPHLLPRIRGGDPVAEARHVHGEDIAAGFALDHPLGEAEPDPATLAEASHHRDGGPVVPQARDRPDQRVSVRGKGEGTVDDGLDASLRQHREAAVGEFNGIADPVELVVEQLVAEIQGRAVDRPGVAVLLVKTDAQPAPFLPQITLALRVHDVRQFFTALEDLRQLLGDQVLVLHGVQRQIEAGERADFTRPQPGGVDHVLGVDRALLRHHVPAAIRARCGRQHRAAKLDLRPGHARGLGVGVGGA